MLTRPKIFFLILFLHAVSFCMGEKVLFIGNSYTAQCSKTISGLFKSESPDWSLSFHTSGGKDLAFHLADSQVTKKINSQKLKLPSGKILKGKERKLFETKKIKLDVLKSEKIIGLN